MLHVSASDLNKYYYYKYKTKINQGKFVVQCVLLCLSYLLMYIFMGGKGGNKDLNFAESTAHHNTYYCMQQLWDIEFFCFA